MNFFTIAEYFRKLSIESEELKLHLNIMADRIVTHESLKAGEEALRKKKLILNMEVYTLEGIAARIVESRKARATVDEVARQVYTNLVELSEYLDREDFGEMEFTDVRTKQLVVQEDLIKIKEQTDKKRIFYEQMENRQVVQKLRKHQKEYADAKEELEKMQLRKAEEGKAEKEKNRALRTEYQQLIVTLAMSVLERTKIEKKKEVAAESWKNPNSLLTAKLRFFDPLKPFAFFNSAFNPETIKIPSLSNFLNDLKKSNSSNVSVELGPILRSALKGKSASVLKTSTAERHPTPKRVTFQACNSCDSSDQSYSVSKPQLTLTYVESESDYVPESDTDTAARGFSMKKWQRAVPSVSENVAACVLQENETDENRGPSIEIQSCRILQTPDISLPKSILSLNKSDCLANSSSSGCSSPNSGSDLEKASITVEKKKPERNQIARFRKQVSKEQQKGLIFENFIKSVPAQTDEGVSSLGMAEFGNSYFGESNAKADDKGDCMLNFDFPLANSDGGGQFFSIDSADDEALMLTLDHNFM